MKKTGKKVLSVLLSVLMLVSVMPLAIAFAADEPAYVNSYVGLGDYAAPALGEGGEGEGDAAAVSIPAQYSLLDPNGDGDNADSRVPYALRNQNPYGSCWAFGTIASVESNIITQGWASADEIDLSELQLIYYMYHPAVDPLGNVTEGEGSYRNDGELVEGGRSDYAMNVLARWNGIGDERVLPYSDTFKVKRGDTYPDTLATQNDYVLKGYYAVNNVTDRDALKAAIIENGVATIGYTHFDNCIYRGEDVTTGETTVNYYTGTDPYNQNTNGGGHAVAIVGWDDNYAKENFAGEYQPANDGAWLIRNSWGGSWGMGGYFWMSYDEKTADTTSFIALMQKAGAYDNNYYYDGGAIYHPSAKVLGAVNMFEAKGRELLKAVSVVFPEDANVNYSVDIYVNPADNNFLKTGSPVASAHTEGTTTFAGMYTIELANPVALEAGDRFAVVIRADEAVTISYDKYSDHDNFWFVNNATYEKLDENTGCSYFINGAGELSSMEERGVARIKAYTETVDADTVIMSVPDIDTCVGNVLTAADYGFEADPESAVLTFTVADTDVASVTADGTLTAKAEGSTTLEIRCAAANTRVTAAVTVSEHDLRDVAEVAPTCTEAGSEAYTQCANCGKIFIDSEEATAEQIAALAIEAAGHDLEKTDRVEATDYVDGNIDYWYCSVCEKYFSDENGENEISLAETVISAPYVLTKVAGKEATCTKDGNVEYYIVTDKATGEFVKYVDADYNDLAEDAIVIKAGHDLEKTDRVEPTCTEKGNIEYYKCNICGRYFTDEAGENEISYSSTILSPKHDLVKTAAKAATCTEDGNIQYFTCRREGCGKIFKYATGSTELQAADTVIPAKGHDLKEIAANEPSCTVDGNIAYWVCKVCGKLFGDAAGEAEISEADTVREAIGHTYSSEVTVPASCTLPGVMTYTCDNGCGSTYTEIIPAAGHQYDENGICTNCGVSKEEAEQSELAELGGPICEYCGRRHGTSWFADFLYGVHKVFKFFKDLFAKVG